MKERIITKQQEARFNRAVQSLNKLMSELQEQDPEGGWNYYLAMETLNIMRGPSHGSRDEMLQENSVVSATIYSCSGGDW